MAKKILLIDDDLSLIRLVEHRLKSDGYEVFFAITGKEGLEKARAEKPDMILLDIVMPVLSGWEVLEELKKDAVTQCIPVIMITAKGDPADLVKFITEGKVADYIMKPYYGKEILEKINRLLSPEKQVHSETHDENMLKNIEQKVKDTLNQEGDGSCPK